MDAKQTKKTKFETPSAAREVIDFWCDAGPERWFKKDAAFDAAFAERFRDLHFAAARGEYAAWEESPDGALALLILLDQYPRNTFRGTGHMYATDELARSIARRMHARGFDREIDAGLRVFCYLPFSHSEDLADQQLAVRCNEPLGGSSLHHAIVHRDIIERFGRFPHRNPMLGRETTDAERAFLAEGGFAG